MKTITKSARLSMKTKTNTLLGAVLFLLVIGAAVLAPYAQSDTFNGSIIDAWTGGQRPLGASTVTEETQCPISDKRWKRLGHPAILLESLVWSRDFLERKLSGDFDIHVDISQTFRDPVWISGLLFL